MLWDRVEGTQTRPRTWDCRTAKKRPGVVVLGGQCRHIYIYAIQYMEFLGLMRNDVESQPMTF